MSQNTETQTPIAVELTITGAFVKKVGRGMPSYPLTPENVAKVFPTDDGKATIGFTISNGNQDDAEAFDGVHMTGACITAKNDLAAIQALANADTYIGIKFKHVGYTFFGPNCVVPQKITKATDAEKLSDLNAVGTPEGQTDKRVWHVSVPLKQDDDGNWVKRFPDVSDKKFAFWKSVVTSVPCLVGKTDEELLAIINA
jgi:hypothetical protein